MFSVVVAAVVMAVFVSFCCSYMHVCVSVCVSVLLLRGGLEARHASCHQREEGWKLWLFILWCSSFPARRNRKVGGSLSGCGLGSAFSLLLLKPFCAGASWRRRFQMTRSGSRGGSRCLCGFRCF